MNDKGNLSIVTIVEEYLESNGYDGLFSDCECACRIGNLMPCGETYGDCEAGYLQECPSDCGDHEFHIGREKPE